MYILVLGASIYGSGQLGKHEQSGGKSKAKHDATAAIWDLGQSQVSSLAFKIPSVQPCQKFYKYTALDNNFTMTKSISSSLILYFIPVFFL